MSQTLHRVGERTIGKMLRKAEFNTSLQQHRRCCFTRSPGWGRTGRHWENEERESRVQSKDIRQESETSVSQKEWEKVQPDFWGAAEVESRATPCCSDRERNPWSPAGGGDLLGELHKERGKLTIKEGKAVFGKGTSRQEWAGILSSEKQQWLAQGWLPGLNTKNTCTGVEAVGLQEESLCCLQWRRNKETAISGFAELSFRTKFKVQDLKGKAWKFSTLLNLISCMTKR